LDLRAQIFLLLLLLLFLLAISSGHVVQNFTLGCLPGGCGATPITTTTTGGGGGLSTASIRHLLATYALT